MGVDAMPPPPPPTSLPTSLPFFFLLLPFLDFFGMMLSLQRDL
jgi:hypothetical protein